MQQQNPKQGFPPSFIRLSRIQSGSKAAAVAVPAAILMSLTGGGAGSVGGWIQEPIAVFSV